MITICVLEFSVNSLTDVCGFQMEVVAVAKLSHHPVYLPYGSTTILLSSVRKITLYFNIENLDVWETY